MFRTQKDEIRKGIQNNAGFTLIEMIVTVAIIAIFSGVVVTLIGTGSNLFRDVSGNTKSQIDAQETLNAIEDLIIDANRSVYYAYGSGTAMGEQIRSDIDDSNAASKTFITCNEYENGDGTSRYVFDVLDWVGSEGKLYYSQRQYTKASSSAEEKDENGSGENPESQQNRNESGISGENAENTDIAIAAESDEENQTGTISGNSSDIARDSEELIERSVFAEGIENFTADVTKVESERIVRFRLTTENNGKKVKTLHTVNLRNRIQVLKPDDAFATAGSTDIRITIVGAPNSIDAGNSKILSYDASGPIDPTTVVWKITDGADNGSFPDLDPTYGKLTVNNNATGTITVIVSARTADGKQTATSAPVTIQINNNRIVTGIETETKSVLVAAGYDGLDLNSEIIWKYVYSDGTKGEDKVPVIWTMDNADNCSYASVTSEGQISIGSEAGTSDKGSFTVRATNGEHNVSNTITVKIARIDLSLPENNAIYTVGTPKELHCTYMEGGQVVETIDGNNASDIVNITTKQKPEKASDYSVGGNFAENDIGNWRVEASANVSVRKCYGSLSVTNGFRVIFSDTGQIIAHENLEYDTIVAGRTYECDGYNKNDFYFSTANTNLNIVNVQSITWTLKGEHPGISFKPDGDTIKRKLTVAKNACHGFTLCADYVGVIRYDNGNPITVQLHAERTFKVANGIELESLSGDTAYVYGPNESEDYLLQVLLDVYDVNGSVSKIKVSSNKAKTLQWEGIGSGEVNAHGENWKFHASSNDVGKTLNIVAKLQLFENVYDTKNNYYTDNDNFSKTISVKVVMNYTAEIIASDNKLSLFPGESAQLYLRLKNKKGILNAQVNWNVDNSSAIKFDNNMSYQDSTFNNTKEIPIKIIASTDITQPTTVTLTANYTLKDVANTTGTQSIQLTITPLTLILDSSVDQIYYGDDAPVDISADIVDAQNDQHLTDADGYIVEWFLNSTVNEICELNTNSGANIKLSVKKNLVKAPDKSIPVTVTAMAKKSGSVVCTASKVITVNPKMTIEKAYNCPAGLEQKLEFNSEHENKEIQSIKTSYLTSTGNEPIECKQDDLKILTFDSGNMKVHMNSDVQNFAEYKYVKISVDLGDILYNFYIYPVQNNVYDYELNKGSGAAIAYVPTDIDSIKRLCSLDGDGYTYKYARTDRDGKYCELRYSVYSKTGIGSFNGNYVDSSSNKWFMRRQDNTNDWVFYRLEGNHWYRFHNGDKSEQNLEKKAKITRFYWNLNNKTHLFDDNGKETAEVLNSYFWKKWK